LEKRKLSGVRDLGLVVVGVFIGATLLTPAVAHVTQSVAHVFSHTDTRYYKKTVSDNRYYTKALSNNRYFTKATSNNRFVRTGATAGGDLTGTYPDPSIENGSVTDEKLAPREAVQSPTLLSCSGSPSTNWTTGLALAKPVGFWKDRSGVVHLQGAVGCGDANATESAGIFTLPPGYRPGNVDVEGVVRWAALSGGGVMSQVAVLESGAVVYDGPDDANADDYISLDGLTFRAEG
jgi:hypothetical protein